jgi:hypothetical protein
MLVARSRCVFQMLQWASALLNVLGIPYQVVVSVMSTLYPYGLG